MIQNETNYDPFEGESNVNIVYIGGSITEGCAASTPDKNWVSIVGNTLKEKYGNGRELHNYNVGIGGTGSNLGLMRLQNDVISKNPNMVFVEFAVNDSGSEKGLVQMESIVINLQNMKKPPYIIFIFTTSEKLTGTDYKQYHKRVADFYGIPTVDLDEIIRADSSVKLHDMLTDGVHPSDMGHAYYADKINNALESRSSFVIPKKKSGTICPNSKVVDIKSIPVSDFEASGTPGKDYEIKNEKLYLYTPGTTVTAKYTGDILGIRDYICNKGGKYSVSADGMELYERNTYYNIDWEVLNLGYLNTELPFKEHTVKLTMLEGEEVILGYIYFNASEQIM